MDTNYNLISTGCTDKCSKASFAQTYEKFTTPNHAHHNDGFMNLLPQVGAEDLDQRDLERGDLAVHEDPRQVQLHLEPHVYVGAVDGRGPPEREATVRDLVQAAALRVGQLLVPDTP